MPVTDEQAATLRALLSGDLELHERLNAQIRETGDRRVYSALVAAAFFKAANRKFGNGTTTPDVVSYVADVRSRSDNLSAQLDARAAERLILAAVTDDSDLAGIDGDTRSIAQVILLNAIIADLQLAPASLDEFIAEARKLADDWTS